MKRTLLPLTLGVVLALALSACGPAPVSLDGTSWILAEMDGQPPLADGGITLTFADGRANSHACNYHNAGYEQGRDRLTFGMFMSTMMYCTAEGVMDQESAYLAHLTSATRYELRGSQLLIFSTGGGVLVFDPAE